MPVALTFRVEQLWLDVDRPIQTRGPRGARVGGSRADRSGADRQMEFPMLAPAPRPAPQSAVNPPEPLIVTAPTPDPISDSGAVVPPFGAWLLQQTDRSGPLGEIARAARLDPLFPRRGDADAVRARFSAAGAEGDAFEALGDAERGYERAIA